MDVVNVGGAVRFVAMLALVIGGAALSAPAGMSAQDPPPDSTAARQDSIRAAVRGRAVEALLRRLRLLVRDACPMPVAHPRRTAVPMPAVTPDTARVGSMPTLRPRCTNPLAR